MGFLLYTRLLMPAKEVKAKNKTTAHKTVFVGCGTVAKTWYVSWLIISGLQVQALRCCVCSYYQTLYVDKVLLPVCIVRVMFEHKRDRWQNCWMTLKLWKLLPLLHNMFVWKLHTKVEEKCTIPYHEAYYGLDALVQRPRKACDGRGWKKLLLV